MSLSVNGILRINSTPIDRNSKANQPLRFNRPRTALRLTFQSAMEAPLLPSIPTPANPYLCLTGSVLVQDCDDCQAAANDRFTVLLIGRWRWLVASLPNSFA